MREGEVLKKTLTTKIYLARTVGTVAYGLFSFTSFSTSMGDPIVLQASEPIKQRAARHFSIHRSPTEDAGWVERENGGSSLGKVALLKTLSLRT